MGVLSDCEVGCDIEKNANAPLEVAEHYFYHSELAYIKAAKNKDKAFFTLWTLKESYMKMTGRGMSLPLDSFEVIFSRSAVRGLFLFTIHWKLFSTIFMYDHRGFFRRILEFQSDRKAYMSDIASAVREN